MTGPLLRHNHGFRHIVFTDTMYAGGRGCAINFAPDRADRPVEAYGRPVLTAELGSLLTWLFEQAGLDVRHYRVETLHRRAPACLRALRAVSPAHARWLIEQSPSLLPVAIGALVIGVTSFFRDTGVFHALGQLLPGLCGGRGGPRIWSVGCSDGSELYSVAMLLAEQKLLHRVYLLGTDCRGDAVKRAASGAYSLDQLRGISPELLERYFVPDGNNWRIRTWLRTTVQWRRANVLQITEPGTWDLILCRNMAMYLFADASASLWERLEGLLNPGGLLVLGKAERPYGATRLSKIASCIYRRDL